MALFSHMFCHSLTLKPIFPHAEVEPWLNTFVDMAVFVGVASIKHPDKLVEYILLGTSEKAILPLLLQLIQLSPQPFLLWHRQNQQRFNILNVICNWLAFAFCACDLSCDM